MLTRRTHWIGAILVFLVAGTTVAQEAKPQAAETVRREAIKQAAAADKTVMLVFQASWCGWCKRLDQTLAQPEFKKVLDAHFVVAHLDVMERGDKVGLLENPGGQAILKKLGGENAGLPFYAFLDAKGEKIADSKAMPDGQNIGYPGNAQEIEAFARLLQKAAKKLTAEERAAVVACLNKNAPPPR
jgi:thiol-disulfide isomerase/thioredoxin